MVVQGGLVKLSFFFFFGAVWELGRKKVRLKKKKKCWFDLVSFSKWCICPKLGDSG
jgi:hypothetical protein